MTQRYTQDDVDGLMAVATQQISELMAERTKLEANTFNFEQAFYDVQAERNKLAETLQKNISVIEYSLRWLNAEFVSTKRRQEAKGVSGAHLASDLQNLNVAIMNLESCRDNINATLKGTKVQP